MSEREAQEKTLFDTRLFRVGIVAAIVGLLIKSAAFLNIGVAGMGAAWATKK